MPWPVIWDVGIEMGIRPAVIAADAEARAIMTNAQADEFNCFGMDLEFLLRRTPTWRAALQATGAIVACGRADRARPRTGYRPPR